MSVTHKHHRKMRSQGGGGHPTNILTVSPELHEMIHHHPGVAYEYGLLVHSYDNPAEIVADIPGFLAQLGHDHDHEGTCSFCGVDLRVKPKRKRFEGEERRQRKTISVKVPNDTEDGGAIWDDTLAEVKSALVALGLYENVDLIPAYEALIAALRDWLNTVVYVHYPEDPQGDTYA